MTRNVWVLMLAQVFNQSSAPVMVLIGGLIGASLAPSPQWVTLPVALMVVGTALAALPVSRLMRRWGRKRVFMLGTGVSSVGAAVAAAAVQTASFAVFCMGSLFLGASLAFVQQYRFAAMESVGVADMPRAASRMLLAGLAAAFVGPELAVWGQHLTTAPYVGSLLGLILLNLFGLLVLSQFHNVEAPAAEKRGGSGRPLAEIARHRVFWIAILGATLGYAVMSFIMTATPVSMHVMQAHSLTETKWVIQSHIAAMYLPSLVSGTLISRFGTAPVMGVGCLAFVASIVAASSGLEVVHYWLALVFLGIGWNFLFVGGTTLLPSSYQPEERFRVQGLNELVVFGCQAVASLSAGWVLVALGWHSMLLLCLPLIAVFALLLFSWWRSG
jgi:MFS family permease